MPEYVPSEPFLVALAINLAADRIVFEAERTELGETVEEPVRVNAPLQRGVENVRRVESEHAFGVAASDRIHCGGRGNSHMLGECGLGRMAPRRVHERARLERAVVRVRRPQIKVERGKVEDALKHRRVQRLDRVWHGF